jgi:murein DD-endopeptidase MepM/ murein hydrolase activator NlpD
VIGAGGRGRGIARRSKAVEGDGFDDIGISAPQASEQRPGEADPCRVGEPIVVQCVVGEPERTSEPESETFQVAKFNGDAGADVVGRAYRALDDDQGIEVRAGAAHLRRRVGADLRAAGQHGDPQRDRDEPRADEYQCAVVSVHVRVRTHGSAAGCRAAAGPEYEMMSRLTYIVIWSVALIGTSVSAQERVPRLSIVPRNPQAGSLVRISINGLTRDTTLEVTGTMAGEPLHFRADSTGALRAFGPVPVDVSDSVLARVQIRREAGGAGVTTDTLIQALHFPHRPPQQPTLRGRSRRARRLRVDRRFSTRPDSALEARIESEGARARDVGRRAHHTPQLWTASFVAPRAARITSGFGSGRVFNGRVSSSHGGVDFAGHTGDIVRAANRGVVALVDSFFLAGNVIYLDHGDGVVTGYFHLSHQNVATGDTVERGQEIGLVGATGRVTGPHLHWAARYGELTVDPMDLIVLTGGSVRAPRAKSGRKRPRGKK